MSVIMPPTGRGLQHLDAPFCRPFAVMWLVVPVLVLVLVPGQWAVGSGQWAVVVVAVHLANPGMLFYAQVSASRIPSHRIGGRASQQQAAWSQKRRWPLPSLA